MNYEIILATGNINKVKEVRQILAPHGIIVYGLKDLNIKLEDIEENGSTYYENALIKAKAIQKITTMPIISDDSGLEIESLGNIPGIKSARYAESFGGHANAIEHILKELNGSKNRKARFICDIVLLNVEEKPLLFEGISEGEIAEKVDGKNGFGYDPVFFCSEANKTYANMTDNEKNQYSHRGKALKKLLTYLKINQLIK